MKLKTKDVSEDVAACWPPKAHMIRREDHPPKEGTIALCGAKLMGIDLDGTAKNTCYACAYAARRMLDH